MDPKTEYSACHLKQLLVSRWIGRYRVMLAMSMQGDHLTDTHTKGGLTLAGLVRTVSWRR